MLTSYPLTELANLRFQRSPLHNEVCLSDFWADGGRRKAWALSGCEEKSVALCSESGWWQVFFNSVNDLTELLLAIPQDPTPKFAALPEACWDLVKRRWPTLQELPHALFTPSSIPKGALPAQVGSLQVERDTDQVWQHQPWPSEYGGVGYLQHRINRGPTACVRDAQGAPIGWALMHDDGTIGSFRVLEAYRGNGYGRQLANALVGQVVKQKLKPIGHICTYNTASLKLAAALGARNVGINEAWVRERTPDEMAAYRRGEF